jgi:hypothetical protein
MIPELNKEKFLPLFQKCMEITGSVEMDKYRYIVRRVPIECQMISTEPRIILSDGFHKVACEVSKEAVTNLKKQYPTIKFKELTNYFITLLEYEPYTYLDEYGNIRLKLNIYNFVLNSPDTQNSPTFAILGSPKKLSATSEIKEKTSLETFKHLKNYLLSSKDLNDLPPLEKILLSSESKEEVVGIKSVIQCPGDDPEDKENLLNYKELEALEDILTEEAGKLLRRQKLEEARQKRHEHKLANMRKCRLSSLSKDLLDWVGKVKDKGIKKSDAVSKGEVLTKTKSTLKGSSEVKYTARGFKKFISWMSHSHNNEENNVKEVIDKATSGPIKIEFATPETRQLRSMDKKRGIPSTVTSCCKSVLKKPKL